VVADTVVADTVVADTAVADTVAVAKASINLTLASSKPSSRWRGWIMPSS
jgi:hypothetical protein